MNALEIDPFIIGNNLRELREQKELTQMELAKKVGVSYDHYAKIEQGMRGMSMKMLFVFMDYYGVDANFILGVEGKEQKQDESKKDEKKNKTKEKVR